MAPILLADNIGPGGTAFLIVMALIVVMIFVFWAMIGSLRRLRQSVARGAFGVSEAERLAQEDAAAQPDSDPATSTPDPRRRGGAGA